MNSPRKCKQCGRSDSRSDAKFCSECGSPFDSRNSEFHSRSNATSIHSESRSTAQTDTTIAVQDIHPNVAQNDLIKNFVPKNIGSSQPRRFRLPDKTSKEQDFALDLPEDGFHLLLGGPGTGKSVIALIRARRLAKKGSPHQFLAFNQLLVHASKNLDKNTSNNLDRAISACTWVAWFRDRWRQLVGTQVPTLGNYFEIDWKTARAQLLAKFPLDAIIPQPRDRYLVIDEGQDMPADFYEILFDIGYKNIFVIADFNQILHPAFNSNYPQLCDALSKTDRQRFYASAISRTTFTENHVVQLTYNHRNSYPVARLARTFYVEAPQNVPPDLPPETRTANLPEIVKYDGNSDQAFMRVVNRILLTSNSDPTRLIGVLCPDNAVRHHYKHALDNMALNLGNGKPRIDSYANDDGTFPNFAFGGIILLNAQACKGLEFDYVIIADIDQFHYWPEIMEKQQMLFYVMVSRAISRVIMIQNTANPCPISAILPTDQNILRG